MNIDFKSEIEKDSETLLNVRDELQHLSIEEVRQVADANRSPFYVACLNVTGNLNVGAIIRTASLMGAQEVLVFGRRRYDRRSTVGAEHYINVNIIDCLNDDLSLDTEQILLELSLRDLCPIIIEGPGYPLITETFWPVELGTVYKDNKMPCFLFGNEGRGVPQNILDTWPQYVFSLPQSGVLRSYNVATAAAMTLFHIGYQVGWI